MKQDDRFAVLVQGKTGFVFEGFAVGIAGGDRGVIFVRCFGPLFELSVNEGSLSMGDRLLLGVAVNEGVTAEDFLTPRPLNLEALSAGGLFKIGTASDKPDQRWVSAVLISDDGIFIDTRRLSVEE